MTGISHRLTIALLAASLGGLAVPGAAQEAPPAGVSEVRDSALISRIREKLSNPSVIMTLRSRNKGAAGVSQADIDALDKAWRAEREQDDQPLITAVLAGPLSGYLLQMQASSLGLYSEIFVMDANGLNAGQSSITSDYWQGDEAKFQKTYDVGPKALFIDEPEYNDETGSWRQQVNMSLTDEGGALIGAATVEINLTELARRRAAGVI